jgi:hypothetical protein
MIRRLNYTGRRTISRAHVTVRLIPGTDGVPTFTAQYDIAEFKFPGEARVYIEAYNSNSYRRFNFGTVGAPEVPNDTRLLDVTPRPLPRFRLKVVDETTRHGLLLGVADKVVPLRSDDDLQNRLSLLPVEFVDLGERVWRLDLSDSPVLELNHRIDNISEAARSSGSFLGLLYPEVLRRVLHRIVVEDQETDPNADEDDWQTQWLRFACAVPGIEPPPADASADAAGDREEWVEAAVRAFCQTHEARRRTESAVAKELL